MFLLATAALSLLAGEEAARAVLERWMGAKELQRLDLQLLPRRETDKPYCRTEARDGRLVAAANTPVALCHGVYHAAQDAGRGLVGWSGQRFEPGAWAERPPQRLESPYDYHYFLNVVTFGYTTAFWDWSRWERELDRMALHGVDMPLALMAQEAIMHRVMLRLGLTPEEADEGIPGPAHLPWYRMGNLTGIDSPLPPGWHEGQIALQHRLVDRMRALGMHPVFPAFSGVVPPALLRRYPGEPTMAMQWSGGHFRTRLLRADSALFARIQKMFIEEWEREFGKGEFYLIDSFNEMELPDGLDLAQYGGGGLREPALRRAGCGVGDAGLDAGLSARDLDSGAFPRAGVPGAAGQADDFGHGGGLQRSAVAQ